MLLKVLLITCLGALQIAAELLSPIPFGPSEMIACGGACNDEQYLVCAKGFEVPYYRSFPNHCYLEVANQCIKPKLLSAVDPYFLEAPDVYCNYHKSYAYFETLTCEQYEMMGIKQKEKYIKQINVIINASDPLSDVTKALAYLEISPNFNDEIEALQQQLNEILVYTDCPSCTEPTKNKYRECSITEDEKFKQAISDFNYQYNKYMSENGPDVRPRSFVKKLLNLMENMLNQVTSVRGIKEYYNKRLESFYKFYVETKQKLENYIITNDIYSVGKTIIDSYKMAVGKLNPNPQCSIVSELNRLSDEIVQIITPFSTSKYPKPSLDAFIKMYGGVTENKGALELVKSYEKIFKTAEQAVLNLIKIDSSSIALGSLRNVLSSVDNLLGNRSTCLGSGLTDEDGEIYDVLLCLSEANCNSANIATLRSSVSKCYNDYSMKEYCRSGLSTLPEVKRYNDLVLCISLALRSPNKEDINCCFK